MDYEDFFAKNISVYAIVGKNGSGKSTLLEMIFRMVNNLSYVLLHDIERAGAYPLRYVYGISANLDYELNGKYYRLCCHDDNVIWLGNEKPDDFGGSTVIVNAKVQVPHVYLNCGLYPKENKFEVDIDQYREIAEKLFYTVVVNYSMQAYVEQDYQDEKTEWGDKGAYSPHRAENAWINRLFHKNDGYMCPIVLNPYRDKGKVDMNREMWLTQQRMEALLFYYKRLGIDYIDGYTLHTIKYKFNPEVVNGYFKNRELKKLLLAIKKKKDEVSIDKELVNNNTKFKYIIEQFKKVMMAKKLNFQQQMLKTFGINYKHNMDNDLLAAELYMICKMVNIALKYPTYQKEKEGILLEDNVEFNYLDILNPQPYEEYIEPMKTLAKKVKDQTGHIGLKTHRTSRYILLSQKKLSQKKKKRGKRQAKLGDAFELNDYIKQYWQNENPNSFERISELLPPSIFSYEVMLEKTSTQYDDDGISLGSIIPMRQMSSGERQFLFTTSTIVYHMQNLRSVKNPSPKYNHFNVVLDEVEICFHPEYQRTFVHKLLSMLTRLGMNNNCSINIWIVTHSPFILSDIPQNNILYLKKGHQQTMLEADNPFGANINDILKQSFFLEHGFMGEFAKNNVLSLCNFLDANKNNYRNVPSMYKNINWDAKRAYNFIHQVGEPLLRTQLLMTYKGSQGLSVHERIEALKMELEALEHEADSSNR
jgi:energy-coupling factor transporter ATP-binding protein EcfA2